MITVQHRSLSRRAMSFMEIMIVLVILSLLMMFSAPTLRNVFFVGSLRTSASELASMIRLARQQAIMRQHATRLALYPQDGSYELIVDPQGVESGAAISSVNRQQDVMEGLRKLDPRKESLSFGRVESAFEGLGPKVGAKYIEFQRDGSATPATIVVQSKDGGSMTIVVSASTGAPRVLRKLPAGRSESIVEPPAWKNPAEQGEGQ